MPMTAQRRKLMPCGHAHETRIVEKVKKTVKRGIGATSQKVARRRRRGFESQESRIRKRQRQDRVGQNTPTVRNGEVRG